MKPLIKINFTDFWHGFIKEDNYFVHLLAEKYTVVIDEHKPDILFFSCYGAEYLHFNCTRVFFTPENIRPDFTCCDYALSFDLIKKEDHHRLPLYALYIEQKKMMPRLLATRSREEVRKVWKEKKKFCCMVVSNPASNKRIQFYKKLNEVKKVDSGGKVLNNTGGPVEDKLAFINDYKFVIAFENSAYPGYTTEKILEPYFMDCIPVYWGNPHVNLDFNPKRFVNYQDFKNEDELISYLLEIEKDEEKAIDILMQPVFENNQIPLSIRDENVLAFLDTVVNNIGKKKIVALTWKKKFHRAKRIYKYGLKRLSGYYYYFLKTYRR